MSDPNMKKQTAFENGNTQTGKEDAVPSSESSPSTGDVYVMYRFRNRDLVDPVLMGLQKRGISYFIGTDKIASGINYERLIAKAISSSKLMLLFWTPDVQDCSDIISEVEFAKKHKKPFIIYKVGDFACDEHRKLYDQIAEYSRYEVPQQTPETIGELADWIQQLLGHDLSISSSPVASQPKPAESVSGDVFISYRQCNADLVASVEEELKKRGITYFIDSEKIKSTDYPRKIAVAINSCKLLLLFWTQDVNNSKYIAIEVALARNLNKPIIIYKLGDFDPAKDTLLYFETVHLDRYEVPQQTPETVVELVNRIGQSLNSQLEQPESSCQYDPGEKEEIWQKLSCSYAPQPELERLSFGDVFISCRHCNSDLVAPVAEELDKRGFTFFMDRPEVIKSEKDSEAIFKAIRRSKLVLLFWTPDVNDSDEIIKQVTLALNLNKKLVVYKVGNFDPMKDQRLYYYLAPFYRYEVPQQTPETVIELVNQIEQACFSQRCCAPRACPPPSCSFEPKISPSGANSVPFFSLFSSIFSFFKWFSKKSVSQLEQIVGKNAVVSQPKPKTPASQQARIVDNNIVVSQPKPKTPVTGDVFISYRSHNLGLVKPILKELNKRGITYFIDREKLKSGNYSRKISVAINSCKVLFLFWTEDVDDSRYIPKEIHLAFDWGKEIVPYKVGKFDIDKQFNVIFYLKSLHILEDSQDSVSDVADSIQQALEELS